MSEPLLSIKFHDGNIFGHLVAIINKTLGCHTPLSFSREEVSILKMNGLRSCVFDVKFDMKYILDYKYNGGEEESHTVVLLPGDLSGHKMKKNDILMISQSSPDSRVTSRIISGMRDSDGGSITFHNRQYTEEDIEFDVPEALYRYTVTLTALNDMFKNCKVNGSTLTIFSLWEEGFQIEMQTASHETKWSSTINFQPDSEPVVCIINSQIIDGLGKLSSLCPGGTCSLSCYGPELLTIEVPVSCYGSAKIYLMNQQIEEETQ